MRSCNVKTQICVTRPQCVNILGGSVYTVKKNAEALVAATKEIGLEVNADKTKYMTVSRDQNAGRIHSMKMDNSPIERVEEFKYLGTTLRTFIFQCAIQNFKDQDI